MSDMADVMAKHQWYDATTDNEDPAIGCTGCADWFGSEDALDDGTFAAHQAAALTAAGFGPVQAARAEAWDEGRRAGQEFFKVPNPYREASS